MQATKEETDERNDANETFETRDIPGNIEGIKRGVPSKFSERSEYAHGRNGFSKG
jgi:hypothetical protein